MVRLRVGTFPLVFVFALTLLPLVLAVPFKPHDANAPWFCHSLECPKFTVSLTNETAGVKYELRKYEAARWMSTTIQFDTDKDFSQAQSEAFMRLFAYISGQNKDGVKIDMTAPVHNEILPGSGPFCKSNLTLSFFVPFKYQNTGPPEPTSSLLYLTDMPAMEVYVIQFATLPPGPSANKLVQEAETLAAALPVGSFELQPYYSAEYDPPFRILKRHDEIWLKKTVKPGPVEVVLLHEALCPYCILEDFHMYDAVAKLKDIANVRTIWWGNAKEANGEIKCQHGPTECQANTFFNCVEKHYQPSIQLQFTHCFDFLIYHGCNGKGCPAPLNEKHFQSFVENCSAQLHLDLNLLHTCAAGAEGKALVEAARQETEKYNHKYVPWVVVDGVHSTKAEKSAVDFIASVCAAYEGDKPLPPICAHPNQPMPAAPATYDLDSAVPCEKED